jgi:hypothetical protein
VSLGQSYLDFGGLPSFQEGTAQPAAQTATASKWNIPVSFDPDFRPTFDKWLEKPAFRLDFVHKTEMDKRSAEVASQGLAMDRSGMDLIKQHQTELQQHNAFISEQIASLNKDLDKPGPVRQAPQISQPDTVGVALAALFGAQLPDVIAGAQGRAVQDENLRFANAQAEDQRRRENIGAQLAHYEKLSASNQGSLARLRDLEIGATQDELDRKFKGDQAQAERVLREREIARKEVSDVAKGTSERWDRLALDLRAYGGVLSQDQAARLDATVDEWNKYREEAGLPKLPYFQQGMTEQARKNRETEAFRQTKLDETIRQFDTKESRLSDADKVKAAKWRADLEVRKASLAERAAHHGASIDIQRERVNMAQGARGEVAKAEESLGKAKAALAAVKARLREKIDPETRKALQQKQRTLVGEVASKEGAVNYYKEQSEALDKEYGIQPAKAGTWRQDAQGNWVKG